MPSQSAAWIVAVLVALLIGCAARGPSPALVAEAGRAEAELRAGCYRCLQDALAAFERLAQAPRPLERARRGAFESALLLLLRAKELGLPWEAFDSKAREWAGRLPTSTTALPAQSYLDAAALVVGEVSGLDPEARQQRARRPRPVASGPPPVPAARSALSQAPPDDLLAGYLALAIDCQDVMTRADLAPADLLARHGDLSLLRFRLGICGLEPSLLTSLRESDPRWVDTLFFEGRREMATQPTGDVLKAADLLSSAQAAFPDSHAITLALATAQNALSEYALALANYGRVLAEERTHRDALLGRVLSLSYLNRHTEAIATATQMIELGTWHIGDAYYWRAWNRYHIYALESAWTDVEAATKLLVSTSVYTLAGFIAFARKELDTAIERFDRAYAIDATNCEAVWTAGLVHVEQQTWPPAAPKFSTAMSCFTTAAAEAGREIETIRGATYADSIKARRMAAAQKRLDTARHRAAQSAFNAAGTYLRLGQKASALSHLDIASEHALLKEKAAALRPMVEKLPP